MNEQDQVPRRVIEAVTRFENRSIAVTHVRNNLEFGRKVKARVGEVDGAAGAWQSGQRANADQAHPLLSELSRCSNMPGQGVCVYDYVKQSRIRARDNLTKLER